MYNTEMKTLFIKQNVQSVSDLDTAEYVFNKISKFEEEYDKDFACMSSDEAQIVINSMQTMRSAALDSQLGVLRRYIRWHIDIGTPGVNAELLGINPNSSDHIKSLLVKDPVHLAVILNKVFAPVSEETIDNIFRLYLWLVYMGMNEEQVHRCTRDDVDYKRMVIQCDNEYFPIYREALDVIVFCSDSERFKDRRTGYVGARDFAPRVPGNELYRGMRPTKNIRSTRSRVEQCLLEAYHNNIIDVKLNTHRTALSGTFYRMYERELFGFPVDFTDDAIKTMRGKEYKQTKWTSINYRRQVIATELAVDYNIWKQAYRL